MTSIAEAKSRISQDKTNYYYMSYPVVKPRKNIIATAAEFLLEISTDKHVEPEMKLWISSNGSIASFHYDMERNYFVQVTGSKTFIIANAHANIFLHPQSYLHPNWRQSPLVNIHSASALVIAAVTFFNQVNFSCISTTADTNTSTKSLPKKPGNLKNPICLYQHLSQTTTRSREDIVAEIFDINEVTLNPGDVLHLPPFFFHCVISGPDSLSLNAWLGSSELHASQKLINVALPFGKADSIVEKIQMLRFTIFRLFWIYGEEGTTGMEFEIFVQTFLSRYSSLVFDPRYNCKRLEYSEDVIEKITVYNEYTINKLILGSCRAAISENDEALIIRGKTFCKRYLTM